MQNLIFDGKISKEIIKDVLEKDLSVFAATNLIKQEITKEKRRTELNLNFTITVSTLRYNARKKSFL